jgi:hypothetical protein
LRAPVAVALALALAGCGKFDRQGPLGALIDRPTPPATVIEGAPTGILIGDRFPPNLPDAAVDQVVAAGLREWLTFAERRSLAAASERAAVAPEGDAIKFQARDGGDAVTAQGSATAVDDVYRSLRGNICRDLRQSVAKNAKTQALTITLCREEVAGGTAFWIIPATD